MSPETVCALREAIVAVRLAAPQQIDARRLAADGPLAAPWPQLQAAARDLLAMPDRATLALLADQLQMLLAGGGCCDDQEAGQAANLPGAADPHDTYFRIDRMPATQACGALLPGLLQALALMAEEALDEADLANYAVIPHALALLCCEQLGVALPDCAWRVEFARPQMHRATTQPVQRWLHGHQVFAVLTQGLIWAMHQLPATAGAAAGDAQAALALHRVRLLLDASAAAFRFTADFDAAHYRDTIRPSMSEPHVPPGFSGTMSVDHAHLVRQMSGLGPQLGALRQAQPEAHAAMAAALSAVYEDHKNVCEHFDGANTPSIRGARSRQASQVSGAEMIDRFKTRRMEMVA